LLIAHVYIPPARYPDSDAITRFCDSFAGRVRALPGVVDASVATGYPPTIGWQQMFTIPGRPFSRTSDVPMIRFAAVDAHYLRTLGFPLLNGRDFAESDTSTSQPVAIVNQAFVERYFRIKIPSGARFTRGRRPESHPFRYRISAQAPAISLLSEWCGIS
jgi:putative ABC transport system permease protein